jgi:hypothetical protein
LKLPSLPIGKQIDGVAGVPEEAAVDVAPEDVVGAMAAVVVVAATVAAAVRAAAADATSRARLQPRISLMTQKGKGHNASCGLFYSD